MWRPGTRVHRQRHPSLSISFNKPNYLSTLKRRSAKIYTSKPHWICSKVGVASCTAAAPQRFYTGAASLRLLDSQDQTDGMRCSLEASSSEDQELRILERGRAFGIMTIQELLLQCAFDDHSLKHARLVSHKSYSENLELWCLLLDFQMLRFGEQGVKRLWHNMKGSGGRVDGFFQGPVSDHLWAVLISIGVKNHSFLRQLCKHEMRSGAKRPSLYVDVVGSLLASNQPRSAYRVAQELQDSHPVTSDDAYNLFTQACNSSNKNALKDFLHVCKTFPKVRIYSRVVPYLYSQERFADAWAVHNFLLSRGDLPSDFESVNPLIAHIASTKGKFEEFLQHLKEHGIAYEAQARRVEEHQKSLRYGIANDSLNIVSSRTMGVQPSRLSDNFVARAFATKAFSFDFILHGLHLLGLREIGPLALRQISLSAGIPSEVCRRLELLKELRVDCGTSMYARVVTSLATQGKATLLSDILASDQHPDVFEDLDLQEKLLAQYYRDSDWHQVDRTLAILRVANQEFLYGERLSMQETSYNVLLRSMVRVGDWSSVTKIVAEVKNRGCRLTTRTLRCMHDMILSKRQPGQRPKLSKSFDDVRFLLSLYQNATNARTKVPPTFWREPIRRLGILRRWSDLERMLFWLAATYSPHTTGFKRFLVVEEDHSISRIFSPALQQAVVEWAFLYPNSHYTPPQAPSRPDVEERQPDRSAVAFERGVRVLRMLHDQYGVPIDESNVRIACLRGLRKRFAPDYFLGRLSRDNIHNKYSASLLPKALKRLNSAWSSSLFDIESTALKKYILRPRRIRRVKQRPKQILRGIDLQTYDQRRQALQDIVLPHCHEDQNPLIAKHQSETDPSKEKAITNSELMEDIVMYRDIYNVSIEDYRRPHSAGRKQNTV